MKAISKLFTLLCVAVVLQGCPYLTVLYVENSTGQKISVHGIEINADAVKDVGHSIVRDGLDFREMSVEFAGSMYVYNLQPLNDAPPDYYTDDSRGRYYRVRLTDDLKLFLLSSDNARSTVNDQPEGFPLTPIQGKQED